MAKKFDKKFYGDNSVGSEQILIEQGQALKILDSTGTEVSLIELGSSDEVIVKGAQVSLKADLDQEIVDRAAGDASTLSSAEAYTDGEISTLSASVTASISAEEAARIAADAVLQGNIDSNYTSLDNYISGVEDALAQEVINRQAATALAQQNANNYTDSQIATEQAARIAGDASLQSQIDAISGGGSGSISALQSELDATQQGAGLNTDGTYPGMPMSNYLAPATTLFGAISALDIFLKSEETARIAEDSNLQSQINNVLSNVDPVALDSLTEVVAAFQAADASLNGAITSLSTGLSADIDAEEAARIAADAALQGEIDAEEIARAAADVTLQNNIDAEESARIAADSALQAEIDAEEVARAAADSALDARVDVLESITNKKEKFGMSNQQTSITLAHTPIAGSLMIFVDQVPMHESLDAGATDDWSVSGTTVTFINDYSATGNKKMQANDTVYVKYQYLA